MRFNVMIGDNFDRSDVDEWCRQMWTSLADGGTWAIPRSGLIFIKRGGKLVLSMAMPYMQEMEKIGVTPESLRAHQDSDFEATREHFGRVGVEVTRDNA
jgi:hypothetical protein